MQISNSMCLSIPFHKMWNLVRSFSGLLPGPKVRKDQWRSDSDQWRWDVVEEGQ